MGKGPDLVIMDDGTYTKEVTIKRYVVISDLQYPYIKKQYVESLLDYIDYVKPDKLLCVGDELDAQTISTYARGTSLEFEGSLQKNIIGQPINTSLLCQAHN